MLQTVGSNPTTRSNAEIAQPAEALDSNPSKCGFDSHFRHSPL